MQMSSRRPSALQKTPKHKSPEPRTGVSGLAEYHPHPKQPQPHARAFRRGYTPYIKSRTTREHRDGGPDERAREMRAPSAILSALP